MSMPTDNIDRTWNPRKPMANHETFSCWMRYNRDFGGKLADLKEKERVVAIQEANMAGVYWRLLWPKNVAFPEKDWWQETESASLGPPRSRERNEKMSKLAEGERIVIQGVAFIVRLHPGQKFVVDLERA